MERSSSNCDSKPAVLDAQELAETIAASYPVLVVDPVQEISRAERSAEHCQLLLLSIEELDRLEIKDSVDRIVVRVAELIQSTIRQTDILGRLDHAEYALLLPATDHEGGIWVAQRTWRLIEAAPPQVQGVALPVSVSIGMSGFRHGDTPQALIGRAQEGRLHVVRAESGA